MSSDTARVSTIELFFDLVFVFTITSLTHLVEHAHGALDYVRALLVLTLVWWIYAGYAWLTNGAGTDRPMRPVLIAAMAGFLVIAIAIPEMFETTGLAFGLGYLFVILIHLGAFRALGGPGIGGAVARLAPFNLGAAALAVAAGAVHASWSWTFLLGAVALIVIATMRHSERGFRIDAPHFVERHGLILIIALGETIVAVGTGVAERGLDLRGVAAIVLSLGLLAAIWWSYFDRDDVLAEHALLSRDADERALVAIRVFWTPFLTMIAGTVLVAAGLKLVTAELTGGGAPAPAWLLATGVAVYFAGSASFRAAVGIQPIRPRVLGAGGALALGFVGMAWGGTAELIALSVLAFGLLAMERASRTGPESVESAA